MRPLPHFFQQRKSIHLRHQDVGCDQVDSFALKDLECLGSVFGLISLIAVIFQINREQFANFFFIVYNQDRFDCTPP